MTHEPPAAQLVDLNRYPIQTREPFTADALLTAREQLDTHGACQLQEFLTHRGLERMVGEARALADKANPSPAAVTPYYGKLAETFPDNHPRRTLQTANMALVGDFNVPRTAAIRRLYEWPPLRQLLAWLVGVPRLHLFADPCQSVNISVMDDGGEQPWHFDSGLVTVTLMLQAAEAGGIFEYVPNLRSEDDQNYSGVADVLAGRRDAVRSIALEPGTLFVFRGEHALHRVSPVGGNRRRLIALYLYDPLPGRQAVRSSNLRLYGPEAKAAMDAIGMREPPTS